MIDATTHTRKIWRSHFDGADSTWDGPSLISQPVTRILAGIYRGL
jgi:hypothetical protein